MASNLLALSSQVAKLKLKQKYKKEYADTNSIEFKKKASEIEDVLFNSMCKRIGCFAVVVTSIKQGSLVVDFNVVFSSTNVSASVVQDAVDVAVKSPQMAALHPDVTSKPQASSKFAPEFYRGSMVMSARILSHFS